MPDVDHAAAPIAAAIIFTPLPFAIFFSIIFYRRRKLWPLAERYPSLVTLFNISYVFMIVAFGQWHLTYGATPCVTYNGLAQMIFIPTCVFALLTRLWILLFQFEITAALGLTRPAVPLGVVMEGDDAPKPLQQTLVGGAANPYQMLTVANNNNNTPDGTSGSPNGATTPAMLPFITADADINNGNNNNGNNAVALASLASRSWFVRHHGWMRRPFLIRSGIIVECILWGLWVIVTSIDSRPCATMKPLMLLCVKIALILSLVLEIISIVILSRRLSRHTQDGHMIKVEFRMLAKVFSFGMAGFLISMFLFDAVFTNGFSNVLQDIYVIAFATAIFITVTIWPLTFQRRHAKMMARMGDDVAALNRLEPLLAIPHFLAAFMAFTNLELSSENLSFWLSAKQYYEASFFKGLTQPLATEHHTNTGNNTPAQHHHHGTHTPVVAFHSTNNHHIATTTSMTGGSSGTATVINGQSYAVRIKLALQAADALCANYLAKNAAFELNISDILRAQIINKLAQLHVTVEQLSSRRDAATAAMTDGVTIHTDEPSTIMQRHPTNTTNTGGAVAAGATNHMAINISTASTPLARSPVNGQPPNLAGGGGLRIGVTGMHQSHDSIASNDAVTPNNAISSATPNHGLSSRATMAASPTPVAAPAGMTTATTTVTVAAATITAGGGSGGHGGMQQDIQAEELLLSLQSLFVPVAQVCLRLLETNSFIRFRSGPAFQALLRSIKAEAESEAEAVPILRRPQRSVLGAAGSIFSADHSHIGGGGAAAGAAAGGGHHTPLGASAVVQRGHTPKADQNASQWRPMSVGAPLPGSTA